MIYILQRLKWKEGERKNSAFSQWMHSHDIQKRDNRLTVHAKDAIAPTCSQNHQIQSLVTVYCSACSGLRDAISIDSHQAQLRAVESFQVGQECFAKHDIDIHQTENNRLFRKKKGLRKKILSSCQNETRSEISLWLYWYLDYFEEILWWNPKQPKMKGPKVSDRI